ncbi:hypothetical protein M378DRAFT_14543 [Amanita muscaria Koide BX008]|uniref:Ubinuclein middle domain-containing protein n=1 Tax=Amanita muscaria (strain Koide BX008) TaxID=946122 RepID=A0A0C2WTW5_AMAMK|nr:hypothetical protein M378DRAFT_14543 [Amanita muscaria Koide BX008]
MTSLAAVLDNSNEALAQKRPSDFHPPSPLDHPPQSPSPPPPHSPSHSSPSPAPANPSDPVPPPPPPLQTIRLEITLGGPEKYEVDVAAMAKQSGQRPPTPVVQTKPEEVSSGGESDVQEGKKKKRKRKKNTGSEYYDITDPFIDDSELAIDERTWFAQTKQQGFYVSSGEVALLKDKSKKPKSKKPASTVPISTTNPTATTSTANTTTNTSSKSKQENGGSRDYPIPVGDESTAMDDGSGGANTSSLKSDEDGEEVGQKRKRYITVVDHSGKRRKVVDVNSFPVEMQVEIEALKEVIAKENWAQKGKFPTGLKPLLANIAMLAVKSGEYEDHFFNLMPTLFPYNKFTMMKLIKRTVFQDHVKYLVDKQEILLKELTELAKAGFAKAEEEWEKSVQAWDKRQEKARLEAAAAAAGGGAGGEPDGDVSAAATPTRHPTEEMDVDGESAREKDKDKDKDGGGGGQAPATAPGKDSHPPSKKYRLTESMKAIVWQLVMLSNECCRLENEKNSLEGSVIQVSEQGSRKVLYQKIVAAFPEGWMSSGQISRDVSSMKKKFEKEAMENEAGNA